jgi:hypothetical protein
MGFRRANRGLEGFQAIAAGQAVVRQDMEEGLWFGAGPKEGVAPDSELRMVALSTRDPDQTDLILFTPGPWANHRSCYQKVTLQTDARIGLVEVWLQHPPTLAYPPTLNWLQISLYDDVAGVPTNLLARCVPVPLPALCADNMIGFLLPVWEPFDVDAGDVLWIGFTPKAYSGPDEAPANYTSTTTYVSARGNRDVGATDFIKAERVEPPLGDGVTPGQRYTACNDRRIWVRVYEDPQTLSLYFPETAGAPTSPQGFRSVMARPLRGQVESAYVLGVRPGHGTQPWQSVGGYGKTWPTSYGGGGSHNHDDLANISGGTPGPPPERYHLTALEYAGTWGHVISAPNFTWTAGTHGSILFVGAAGVLSQDNARLFWDDANHQLLISPEVTAWLTSQFGVRVNTDSAPAGANATHVGIASYLTHTAAQASGGLSGVLGSVELTAGSSDTAQGLDGQVLMSSPGQTLASAYGVRAHVGATAGTITDGIGLKVNDAALSGSGAITKQYGIFIAGQTKGGTLNTALHLMALGTAGQITWGAGTNDPDSSLYMSVSRAITWDVGSLYLTGVLAVGVAPAANRAVNAYNVTAANAQAFGAYHQGDNNYAGAFASNVYGSYNLAEHMAAGQNATTAAPGALLGIGGVTNITADNVTVTGATGVFSQIRTSAGTARAYTSAFGLYLSTSIGSGGSIGTYYGVYMPTLTGTTRWGVYIADALAKSYFAEQVQIKTGAVDNLSLCGLADPDSGMYFLGANNPGLAAGGAVVLDWHLPAAGQPHVTLAAGTYVPANAGDMAMHSTDRALEHFVGGAVHYNGHTLFCGPTTAETQTGNAVQAEAILNVGTAYSIPAALWAAGKGFRITAYIQGHVTNNTGNMSIMLRLGGIAGLIVAESLTLVTAPSGSNHYGNAILECMVLTNTRAAGGEVTCRAQAEMLTTQPGETEAFYNSNGLVMYRDAGTEALDTTAAQAVTITYTVGGANPGNWDITLKHLTVESLK